MEVFLRGDLVNLVTDISESEEKENQEVADKLVLHACYMCYMRKTKCNNRPLKTTCSPKKKDM
jgi:endonuclease III